MTDNRELLQPHQWRRWGPFFPLCAFFLSFATGALAGSGLPEALPPAPIEARMDLGFLGFLGASMRYSVDGRPIRDDGELKERIYSLHDEQASRLIRESGESRFVTGLFLATGALLGADVALLYKPVPFVRVDWIDRISTGLVTAQFLAGVGFIFNNNAEGLKFNAVQRYNRLLRRREASGLNLSPEVIADGSHWGLGLGCAF